MKITTPASKSTLQRRSLKCAVVVLHLKANKIIAASTFCATQKAVMMCAHICIKANTLTTSKQYSTKHSTAPLQCHKVSQNQAAHMQTILSEDNLLRK